MDNAQSGGRSALAVSAPANPDEVAVLLEGHPELTPLSPLNRLADAARQVDVCRGDCQTLGVLFDRHDPVQGVFRLFDVFLTPRHADELVLVRQCEGIFERDDAGGKPVIDAAAGWAELIGVRLALSRDRPCPAPFVHGRAALGTRRSLRQLLLVAVGIEDVIQLRVPGDSAAPGPPLRTRLSNYSSYRGLELTPVNEPHRVACDVGRGPPVRPKRPADLPKEESVPVWRLTPTSLADPNWAASSRRGAAVVRAPSEAAARRAAAGAFDIATRFRPSDRATLPPWARSELLRAIRIDEPR